MRDGFPPDDASTTGEGAPDEEALREEAPPEADQPEWDGHAGSDGLGLLDELLVVLAIAGVVALLLSASPASGRRWWQSRATSRRWATGRSAPRAT